MKAMDNAYNNSHYVAPKYTMRAKTSFGAQIRAKMSESSDTAGPIDIGCTKHENPNWTIRKRTCKLLQLPGMTMDSVPGPGTYPVPSTTYFDHPCLKMPGRTTMKGPSRFETNPKKLPGPGTYDTQEFYKVLSGRPPAFSMRAKPKLGGVINPHFCDVTSGPIDVNIAKEKMPAWTIRKRTCKLLQLPGMTMDSVPGPGTYPVPSTTYFDHPTMSMPGRTKFPSAPRFKDYDPDDV